jgi:hypothetical protein
MCNERWINVSVSEDMISAGSRVGHLSIAEVASHTDVLTCSLHFHVTFVYVTGITRIPSKLLYPRQN